MLIKGGIMESEEYLKRSQEIIDNSNCWEGLEIEVMKLFVLFTRCEAIEKDGEEDLLVRRYVVEKTSRLLHGIPIILDDDGARMYASLRLAWEDMNAKLEKGQ